MSRSDSHSGPGRSSPTPGWRLPPPQWVSRVASFSLQTYRRHYPGGPIASVCSSFRRLLECDGGGLPSLSRGRLPLDIVSRPARRSLFLRSICLLGRLVRPIDIGSFSRFVTSSTVPTATGWNNQPPGRVFHPLDYDTFARRTTVTHFIARWNTPSAGPNPFPNSVAHPFYIRMLIHLSIITTVVQTKTYMRPDFGTIGRFQKPGTFRDIWGHASARREVCESSPVPRY